MDAGEANGFEDNPSRCCGGGGAARVLNGVNIGLALDRRVSTVGEGKFTYGVPGTGSTLGNVVLFIGGGGD